MSNSPLRTFLVGLVALFSPAAFANSFDFSYQFTSGTTVTGTFDGTLDPGNPGLIGGVSNVSLAVNGVPTGAVFFTAQYDGTGWVANPIVSFDLLSNNFLFIDSDLLNGDWAYSNQFWIILSATSLPAGIDPLGTYLETTQIIDADGPGSLGTWQVTEKQISVSDNASTAFALGLALVGLCWLRRRRVL